MYNFATRQLFEFCENPVLKKKSSQGFPYHFSDMKWRLMCSYECSNLEVNGSWTKIASLWVSFRMFHAMNNTRPHLTYMPFKYLNDLIYTGFSKRKLVTFQKYLVILSKFFLLALSWLDFALSSCFWSRWNVTCAQGNAQRCLLLVFSPVDVLKAERTTNTQK